MRFQNLILIAVMPVLSAGMAAAAPAKVPPPPPPPPAAASPAPVVPADPTKAEGHYKNIQVLNGIPWEDLVPAMQFITASLGVDCEFCHVDRAPEKDDKKEKETARKMITMMRAINRDNFSGREVTCVTCHHGASHPASIPEVAKATDAPATHERGEHGAPSAERPAAAAVLAKYLEAVGGRDAIAKVDGHVQKGTLTGFGPDPVPVEVKAKAGGKRIAVVHNPRGDNTTAVDGDKGGWLGNTGRPPREMSATESAAARLDAALLYPADITPLFAEFATAPSDPIDGKETVLVVAKNPGKPPTRIWFDAQSGLAVRLLRLAETPLGRNPTQVDFADYRDAGGVKIPFRWTVSRPSGQFTIQLSESRQDVPVPDAVFEKPPADPPPPPPPS